VFLTFHEEEIGMVSDHEVFFDMLLKGFELSCEPVLSPLSRVSS